MRGRWATRRRALVALAAAALAPGCGFRPLYDARARVGDAAPEEVALAQALAGVAVAAPRTKLGQVVKITLEDALAPGAAPRIATHALEIELERQREAAAIQLDSTITRFDLTLRARASLRPLVEDARPAARVFRLRRVASYNQIGEPFATLVSEEAAGERAAREIALELRNLLALHFIGEEF